MRKFPVWMSTLKNRVQYSNRFSTTTIIERYKDLSEFLPIRAKVFWYTVLPPVVGDCVGVTITNKDEISKRAKLAQERAEEIAQTKFKAFQERAKGIFSAIETTLTASNSRVLEVKEELKKLVEYNEFFMIISS